MVGAKKLNKENKMEASLEDKIFHRLSIQSKMLTLKEVAVIATEVVEEQRNFQPMEHLELVNIPPVGPMDSLRNIIRRI